VQPGWKRLVSLRSPLRTRLSNSFTLESFFFTKKNQVTNIVLDVSNSTLRQCGKFVACLGISPS
jgi:hypothetical protein